jgi:hypothetical protein
LALVTVAAEGACVSLDAYKVFLTVALHYPTACKVRPDRPVIYGCGAYSAEARTVPYAGSAANFAG